MEQVNKGNYQAIVDYACSITDNLSPRDWILEGHGANLVELETLPSGPTLTGFAFLVLLSKFLRENPFGYGDVGAISHVVLHLGWKTEEVNLFRQGMRTSHLFKPGQVQGPADDPRWYQDEYYWWWVRPLYAYYTSWLNKVQVNNFHRKLVEVRPQVELFDPSTLHVPGLTITRTEMLESYQYTVDVFRAADELQIGLFSVIS